jgi:hypothetical protein
VKSASPATAKLDTRAIRESTLSEVLKIIEIVFHKKLKKALKITR